MREAPVEDAAGLDVLEQVRRADRADQHDMRARLTAAIAIGRVRDGRAAAGVHQKLETSVPPRR